MTGGRSCDPLVLGTMQHHLNLGSLRQTSFNSLTKGTFLPGEENVNDSAQFPNVFTLLACAFLTIPSYSAIKN